MTLTMAGLCAGAGGLEAAVSRVTGAVPLWLAENDPWASAVLAERFPGVPNIGDITAADWSSLPPVDVLAAGFPCTDISDAGPRTGITGPRSGVWANVADAVSVLRPSWVFLENVAALRGRGLDTVVRDLAATGYGLRWTAVYAADVDACHYRRRWFGLARPLSSGPLPGRESVRQPLPFHGSFTGGSVEGSPAPVPRRKVVLPRLPTTRSRDAAGSGNLERRAVKMDDLRTRIKRTETGAALLKTPTSNLGLNGGPQDPRKRRAGGHGPNLEDEVTHLLPTPKASDGPPWGPSQRDAKGNFYLPGVAAHLLPSDGSEWSWVCTDGRDFGPAVHRWQGALQRGVPCPVVRGRTGGLSLAPAFAEWMMGWPPGHATRTHVPIPRSQQLKIIGNGVVPRQAVFAYRFLLDQWKGNGGG